MKNVESVVVVLLVLRDPKVITNTVKLVQVTVGL